MSKNLINWTLNKMPKSTAKTRLDNIAKENATVTIEDMNYDDCIRLAAKEAAACENGIIIQASVGSLAGAVIGYFSNSFKDNPPVMVVVEAKAADCLYRSGLKGDGSTVNVTGDMFTIMAGLSCGEANSVSWDILRNHADAFVSCPDWISANGTRIYAAPLPGDSQIISGESGSVTLGLVHAIMTRPEYAVLKAVLKLDSGF